VVNGTLVTGRRNHLRPWLTFNLQIFLAALDGMGIASMIFLSFYQPCRYREDITNHLSILGASRGFGQHYWDVPSANGALLFKVCLYTSPPLTVIVPALIIYLRALSSSGLSKSFTSSCRSSQSSLSASSTSASSPALSSKLSRN
jgi:hypothetical protein